MAATPAAASIHFSIRSTAKVIAVEAETGKILWTFDPKLNTMKRSNALANRGAAFWKNNEDERIFVAVQDGRLVAVHSRDGHAVASFGDNGYVDLKPVMMPEKDISMNACVDCHKLRKASVSCDRCHDM